MHIHIYVHIYVRTCICTCSACSKYMTSLPTYNNSMTYKYNKGWLVAFEPNLKDLLRLGMCIGLKLS